MHRNILKCLRPRVVSDENFKGGRQKFDSVFSPGKIPVMTVYLSQSNSHFKLNGLADLRKSIENCCFDTRHFSWIVRRHF